MGLGVFPMKDRDGMLPNRRGWRRTLLAFLLTVWCALSPLIATGGLGSFMAPRCDSAGIVEGEHAETQLPVPELVAPTDELLAAIRSDFDSYGDTLLERMKPVLALLGARAAAAFEGVLFAHPAETFSARPFLSLVTGHVRLQI